MFVVLLLACGPRVADGDAPKGSPAPSPAPQTGVDGDGDGYGVDDCDDTDPAVNPGATEDCDAVDSDCDTLIGEDDPDVVPPAWFTDLDGDGVGVGSPVRSCVAPADAGPVAGDCDDADAAVYPGAPEICSFADEDCDGLVDDADADVVDGPCRVSPWGDASVEALSEGRLLGILADSHVGTGVALLPDLDGDGAPEIAALGTDALWIVPGPVRGDVDVDVAPVVFTSPIAAWSGDVDFEGVLPSGDGNGDGQEDLWIQGIGQGSSALWLVDAFVGGSVADVARTTLTASNQTTWFALHAATGDLDGDGLSEVAVSDLFGGYADDGSLDYQGAIYLVPGTVSGAVDVVAAATAIISGEPNDRTGASVALGDLDGDGLADLATGTDNFYAASAWYQVPVGVADDDAGDLRLTGLHYLYQVAVVPDADGDGRVDLLLAHVLWGLEDEHRAVLVSGGTAGTLSAESAAFATLTHTGFHGASLASDVASAGDLDGDGQAELAMGAPNEDWYGTECATYVVPLPVSGTQEVASVATLIARGENGDTSLGTSVAGGRDLDRDGFDDLAVGAPYQVAAGGAGGAIYVLYGGAP